MENLKFILPNERSQPEKAPFCIILIIWDSEKGKTMEKVKTSMVARIGGRRDEEAEPGGLLGQLWK